MKKGFISALAALSLAACVQEAVVDAPQGDAISFENAFVDNATKGAAVIDKNSLDAFNVWGFINSTDGELFNNTTVALDHNTGTWSYDGVKYWIPEQNYYFAALAPIVNGNAANCTIMPATGENAERGLGTVQFVNDGSVDLIYASAHRVSQAAPNPAVAFTFKHLLSKVKFSFTSAMGEDFITAKVRDIKMVVPAKAAIDLTAESPAWSNYNEETATLDFGTSDAPVEWFAIPTAAYNYAISFFVDIYQAGTQTPIYTVEKTANVNTSLVMGNAYNFSATISPETLAFETIEFTVSEAGVEDWATSNANVAEAELKVAAQFGGNYTLASDITLTSPLVVNTKFSLDLGGHTLAGGKPYVSGLTGADISAVVVDNGGNLTISGEGTISGSEYGAYAKNGSLTIKGGNIKGGTTAVQVADATVNIEGGCFSVEDTDKRYVINCIDANWKNKTAKINITGGWFEGFNPADNAAEGNHTNFMEEEMENGYYSVADGDWFKVVHYDAVVESTEQLIEGVKTGGSVLLTEDITIEGTLDIKAGKDVVLDLNGKTISIDTDNFTPNGNGSQYVFIIREGGSVTIDGNGTIETSTPAPIFFYPAGDLVIESGTFIRHIPEGYTGSVGRMFVGTKPAGGWDSTGVTINGGYFDSGYKAYITIEGETVYLANYVEKILAGEATLEETADDIAKRGQPGDNNITRKEIKDLVSITFNRSNNNFKVYGGTFVGANPAWGDEGGWLPTTPNWIRPWSYYQGAFLEGQQQHDDRIVLPEGYTITKGVHEDGRPTYTVTYNK